MIKIGIALSLFFGSLSLQAQEDPYRVSFFVKSKGAVPANENEIISSYDGGALQQLAEFALENNNALVMRRRYGPGEYLLYHGKKNETSGALISAFRIPDSVAVGDFVYQKFYLTEFLNTNLDIPTVYFDSTMIYVENAARLFYYDQGWRVMEMIAYLPSYVNMQSEPSGATILVDNRIVGKTPQLIGPFYKRALVVTLQKEGHRPQELFLNLYPGENRQKQVLLPKTGWDNFSRPATMTDMASLHELAAHIEDLSGEIEMQKERNVRLMEQWEREYTPPPSRGEFEKSEIYKKRTDLYKKEKINKKTEMLSRTINHLYRLEKELIDLEAYRSVVEQKLFRQVLTEAEILIERYDADYEFFPVEIKVNEAGHGFTFFGRLYIPITAAQLLRESQGQCTLDLYFKYRIIKHRNELKPFYVYAGFYVLFRGQKYTLKGEFSFPDRVEIASKQY